VEQIHGIHFRLVGYRLGEVGKPDQQQQNERNGRQQCVECQGAGEEGNIVFISGLEGTAQEAGG
jgi:hypothetical protein